MSEMRFTEDHEWIVLEAEDVAVVGITDYAQEQLGELVFVELPEIGIEFAQGGDMAVIESVKAAGEVKAPVSGTIVDTNESLVEDPGKVNTDAEGEGWFLKLRLLEPEQLDGLMDADAYRAYVDTL